MKITTLIKDGYNISAGEFVIRYNLQHSRVIIFEFNYIYRELYSEIRKLIFPSMLNMGVHTLDALIINVTNDIYTSLFTLVSMVGKTTNMYDRDNVINSMIDSYKFTVGECTDTEYDRLISVISYFETMIIEKISIDYLNQYTYNLNIKQFAFINVHDVVIFFGE